MCVQINGYYVLIEFESYLYYSTKPASRTILFRFRYTSRLSPGPNNPQSRRNGMINDDHHQHHFVTLQTVSCLTFQKPVFLLSVTIFLYKN